MNFYTDFEEKTSKLYVIRSRKWTLKIYNEKNDIVCCWSESHKILGDSPILAIYIYSKYSGVPQYFAYMAKSRF